MDPLWLDWIVPQPRGLSWPELLKRAERHHSKIVNYYHPLVQRVSGKMWRSLPSQVELDDIVQFGSLGLLRAVDHYDPTSGVNFETYAVASIRGLILDELRSQDWAPRSLRRRQREIDKATEALESQLGHSPSLSQIASKLGLTVEEVRATMRSTEVAKTQSLDESAKDDEGGSRYEAVEDTATPDPERARESRHVYSTITDMIKDFTLQEQCVLALYYYEALTLAEVGRVLGIPESRASQIHTRSMVRIREKLVSLLAS